MCEKAKKTPVRWTLFLKSIASTGAHHGEVVVARADQQTSRGDISRAVGPSVAMFGGYCLLLVHTPMLTMAALREGRR